MSTWRQEKVEGWKTKKKWKIFHGEFTDAETGEHFGWKGKYIYKRNEKGELITVQWELELPVEERPGYKKNKAKNQIITREKTTTIDPSQALAMFNKALAKNKKSLQ